MQALRMLHKQTAVYVHIWGNFWCIPLEALNIMYVSPKMKNITDAALHPQSPPQPSCLILSAGCQILIEMMIVQLFFFSHDLSIPLLPM